MAILHSRRSILGRLAAAMASTPVAAAALSPSPVQAQQPLKGLITPDQYISELLAIGWEPYTINQTFPSGKVLAVVFEAHTVV
jgi:hypothetical protein